MDNKRLGLLYNLESIYNKNQVGTISYQLAGYFLRNYSRIDTLNIYDIAAENFVSRASVRRFCESLGYENFKEMKQHFIDFDDGKEKYLNFYSATNFIDKLQKQINILLENLRLSLESQNFKQIIRKIQEADEIIVIASSTISGNIKIFQQNMAILGKKVSLITDQRAFESIEQISKAKSIVLFFSISGILAESFAEVWPRTEMKKYLFTLNHDQDYQKVFDAVYYLSNLDNLTTRDIPYYTIPYYTYGVAFILDLILNEYVTMTQKNK